jgi:hypothetical protein
MNYAADYTIILTALYVLIIAIAFAPKCPQTVSPDSPVEYFPEIEAVELAPIPSLENLPVEPVTPSPAPVSLPQAIAPEIPLTALGIRELKKLASKAKIKRYSSLNKKQLILALT